MKTIIPILILCPCISSSAMTNGDTSTGIHIFTSTSYDYSKHKGIVSIESFVEGRVTIIQESKALDIVLVLDVSESMDMILSGEEFIPYDDFDPTKPYKTYYDKHDYWFGTIRGGYVTKLGRMMDAAYSFVESIEANARATGLTHRVGIVTFSSTYKTKIAMPLTEVSGRLDEFKGVIYGFEADGATASDEGLRLAIQMLREVQGDGTKPSEAGTGRTSNVLMFTDGEPTNFLAFENYVANDAIEAALTLKSELGCTIYAVGMFDADVRARVLNYMNAVSSNYPEASSLDHMGEGSDQGYYVSISQAGQLSSVFDSISEEIILEGALVDINASAQIVDYMPPYMQLPKGTSISDIHCYTVRCTGYEPESGAFSFSSVIEPLDIGEDGITISTDEDGCVLVSVTGFDYSQHWCGPGMSSGRKLLVHIPFEISAVNEGVFNPNLHESDLIDPFGNTVGSFQVQTLRFYDLTVECSGLCHGESAIYRILDPATGRILCRFALNESSQIHPDESTSPSTQSLQSRTLRNVPEGHYIIIEEGWNWAYTTLPGKYVEFDLSERTTLHFDVTHKSGPNSPLHTEVHRSNN